MTMESSPLKAAVVGCRRGGGLARLLNGLDEYELVAVCDLDQATAEAVAKETGNPRAYTQYLAMLPEVKPEVVVIATPNISHASMTRQAAEAGVKGVYCEKPMATCLADARAMVEACQERGVALAIGHQRRMSGVYRKMRQLIEEGTIGLVYLIRASCGGDLLTDGTHAVDSVLHLAGDANVKWAVGQVFRDPPNRGGPKSMGFNTSGGWRYGHMVETGAMGTFEFGSGLRAELFTGQMNLPGRGYQDIEIFGTTGRLWRAGDRADPPLQIQDDKGGGWRAVPLGDENVGDAHGDFESLRRFASTVREGTPHPLCGENALRGFEVLMAIYESARVRRRILLPLEQERFPLEVMLEEREL